VDEELSLGDFVLTGGEIAAMAVADSVCRLVPGVLADEQCYVGESHWDGLLEYPQYTRPEVWEGRAVPEVLLAGDHERVERWRREQQFLRTRDKRPDLYEKFAVSAEADKKILRKLESGGEHVRLTLPVDYRPAVEMDLPAILAIIAEAREDLQRQHIDQWQGSYPGEGNFRVDLERGECFVVYHGEEIAGVFTLTTREEASYDAITDGKWTPNLPYCTLLIMAVARRYRGSGLAQQLMKCVERQAREYSLRCIRTDTHKKNKASQALLRECGYRYRGNVLVRVREGHDPARQGYEKILKK
jgi:GNAT superfamily N-acetyltransferase